MATKSENFETLAVHAGQVPDATFGAVVPPLYVSSTYAQTTPGDFKKFDYSRAGNPTRENFEVALAALEGGTKAFAFSSGCAATTTILSQFQAGDHILAGDDLYGGSRRLMSQVFAHLGLQFDFVDTRDLSKVESAIKSNTKLIWVETPTNPTMKLTDLEGLAKLAKAKNILTAVDNTFMSPYFQRPLTLGIDIVMHSATKYLGGHSDLIAGAVVTNRDDVAEKIGFLSLSMGAIASPWDCHLLSRSLKTLAVRMDRHQENALKVANYLESHSKVEKVSYPGLESFPQFELAKKQMSGFGGMLSFYLKGGLAESRRFLEAVKIFTLAESLGGVESLIEHPALMTHGSVPAEHRKELGIVDNFVRVSVGIENSDDLIQDLEQALGQV